VLHWLLTHTAARLAVRVADFGMSRQVASAAGGKTVLETVTREAAVEGVSVGVSFGVLTVVI
jgi:hypothetical protein